MSLFLLFALGKPEKFLCVNICGRKEKGRKGIRKLTLKLREGRNLRLKNYTLYYMNSEGYVDCSRNRRRSVLEHLWGRRRMVVVQTRELS